MRLPQEVWPRKTQEENEDALLKQDMYGYVILDPIPALKKPLCVKMEQV